MAWIESHQEIGRHPKVRKLARTLGVSIPSVVGHLHLLWHWCLDFAEDGILSEFAPDEIADGAMWEGDPGIFIQALIDCGWIDRDGESRVHDWDVYTGRIQAMRENNRAANRERQRRYRERQKALDDDHVHGSNALRNVTVTLDNAPTVPNQTKPNQTEPITKTADAAAPPRVRDDDPLFEVVAEVCYGGGLPYAEFKQRLSSTNRSRINKALTDLKRIGVSVADVRGYAANYRARSPDFPLKPQTIVEGITEHVNKASQNGQAGQHATNREHSELTRQRRLAAAQEAGLIPHRDRAAS